MGKYLNVDSKGKPLGARFGDKLYNLIQDGAKYVEPTKFVPNMVCVVDNGHFGAAGYAYDEREFEAFKRPDGRFRTWLTYDHVLECIDKDDF